MKRIIMVLLVLFSIISVTSGEQINNSRIYLYKKYLVSDKSDFQSTRLPFSMREYIDDVNKKYHNHSYVPSDVLIDYLLSIDYEGEEYICFILPMDNENLTLLTHIIIGDNEYYLLMLLNSNGVITYEKIGKGGDSAFLFVINNDCTVNLYDRSGKDLQRFLIQKDKIVEIK